MWLPGEERASHTENTEAQSITEPAFKFLRETLCLRVLCMRSPFLPPLTAHVVHSNRL